MQRGPANNRRRFVSRLLPWQHGERGRRHAPPCNLPGDRLRLLSFNVQAGIGTQRLHQYVTHSWRHVVVHPDSIANLDRIAEVVRDYDIVALQEVDTGSLRSGFVNQLRHIAQRADFPWWHQQLNRDLGRLGQFSNGMLSRFAPHLIEDHRLPGPPGRGAVVARYGNPHNPLVVVGVHLALGESARNRQLDYICSLVEHNRHVVVMGDLNLSVEKLRHTPLARLGLQDVTEPLLTYPSWRPDRHIDHILATPTLQIERLEALDCTLSDHRPVAMEIRLPPEVLAG